MRISTIVGIGLSFLVAGTAFAMPEDDDGTPKGGVGDLNRRDYHKKGLKMNRSGERLKQKMDKALEDGEKRTEQAREGAREARHQMFKGNRAKRRLERAQREGNGRRINRERSKVQRSERLKGEAMKRSNNRVKMRPVKDSIQGTLRLVRDGKVSVKDAPRRGRKNYKTLSGQERQRRDEVKHMEEHGGKREIDEVVERTKKRQKELQE